MQVGDLVIPRRLMSSEFQPWNGKLCVVVQVGTSDWGSVVIKRLDTGEVLAVRASKLERADATDSTQGG